MKLDFRFSDMRSQAVNRLPDMIREAVRELLGPNPDWKDASEIPIEEIHDEIHRVVRAYYGNMALEVGMPQIVTNEQDGRLTIELTPAIAEAAMLSTTFVVDSVTRKVRQANSIVEQVQFMQDNKERVGLDVIQNGSEKMKISTVFLGSPANAWCLGESGPEFFETLVFNHPLVGDDIVVERYPDHESALQGHQRVVKEMQALVDNAHRALVSLLKTAPSIQAKAVSIFKDETEEGLF